MAMPGRICAYRANAQHREIHNQRLIKSPLRPGYQQTGPDEIPPSAIKKAWPVYQEEITLLFYRCLNESYHLYTFKNATLCSLPEPGKQSRLLPRSYQLTALLSCLGKLLERVVARSLAHLALKYKLFTPLHFGATPRRSAVDAAATLTHDEKKAFQDQEVISTLAFDIKKAFDSVGDSRLVKRLWEQGIPLPRIRWVAFFLNDRTGALRLDKETRDQESVKIGVPQRSPIVSIPFMLFTAPLFKILTKEDKNARVKICGYLDNGFLTSRSLKKDVSAAKFQEKFEAIHFY